MSCIFRNIIKIDESTLAMDIVSVPHVAGDEDP